VVAVAHLRIQAAELGFGGGDAGEHLRETAARQQGRRLALFLWQLGVGVAHGRDSWDEQAGGRVRLIAA
jgi:hypothetical protein